MPFIITADSEPVYDSLGWGDYWSCDDWLEWHKALKKKFGSAIADPKWVQAWNAQTSFSAPMSWCKYGGVFNEYVRKEKLNVTWWLPNLLNSVTSVAEDAGDAAKNTSNVLKVAIPIIIIAAALGVMIYAAKKFNIIK